MSLDDPVSGLFTQEWERFKTGVAALDPNGQLQTQEAFKRESLKGRERNVVSIPGWDDVVHLGPRLQPTPQQRDEYWNAKRAGRKANLPADVDAELQRRADVVRRIKGAPDAEMAASWGRILTALDNVQDFFSTLATFGRLALWLAPRIAGRFVPGLNIIILASDLLNALSLLGMTSSIFYALLCKGPLGALAAGVPVALFKQGLKSELWKLARTDPRSRVGRLRFTPELSIKAGSSLLTTAAGQRAREVARLARLPSFGNALEVLQTTDQLWGWGVSFGAIVGTITQSAAAVTLAAQGAEINYERTVVTDKLNELINRPLREDPVLDLWALHSAASVMAAAPAILRRPEHFSDYELLTTLVAHTEAQRLVYSRLNGYPWQALASEALELELAPVQRWNPTTERTVRELGLDPLEGHRWDSSGAPATIELARYVDELGPIAGPAIGEWARARRHSHTGALAGALVNASAEEAWRAIMDDPEAVDFDPAPDYRLLAGLAEAGWLVSVDAPESTLWAFWQAARANIDRLGGANADPEAWKALAGRFGVPLIRQLPPGSPWPAEWHEWLRSVDSSSPPSSPPPARGA